MENIAYGLVVCFLLKTLPKKSISLYCFPQILPLASTWIAKYLTFWPGLYSHSRIFIWKHLALHFTYSAWHKI